MEKTGRILIALVGGTTLIGLAYAKGARFGTANVTSLGCAGARVTVNGTTTVFVNNGASSWPSELSCIVDGTGNGVIAVAASGTLARRMDGPIRKDVQATFLGSFQITTTTPAPALYQWTLVGQERVSAYAQGIVWANGASATAKGTSIGKLPGHFAQANLPEVTTIAPDPEEKTDGPKVVKRSIPLSSLLWGPTGGVQSCVAKIPSGIQAGSARAIGLGLAGNVAAASAGASGGWSFYPTGAKSTAGGGAINVPSGRNGVCVKIYNASGVLVDVWSVDALNGVAPLFIDDYAPGQYVLAFSTSGALVKKMSLTLDPNASQTLSPAWKYGDLDGDNHVTQAEASFVAAHVGYVVSSDPTASDKVPDLDAAYAVANADLDGDGTVTQADVNLAQANVGTYGD